MRCARSSGKDDEVDQRAAHLALFSATATSHPAQPDLLVSVCWCGMSVKIREPAAPGKGEQENR